MVCIVYLVSTVYQLHDMYMDFVCIGFTLKYVNSVFVCGGALLILAKLLDVYLAPDRI